MGKAKRKDGCCKKKKWNHTGRSQKALSAHEGPLGCQEECGRETVKVRAKKVNQSQLEWNRK